MVRHLETLPKNIDVLRTRLISISSPFDDSIFLDLSLSTRGYRVVKKDDERYVLYVSYKKLGFFGNFSNYKMSFALSADGNDTSIIGNIRLKIFSAIVLISWYSSFALILGLELGDGNLINYGKVISSAIFVFAWVFIEYFFFRRKVEEFFYLLLESQSSPSDKS